MSFERGGFDQDEERWMVIVQNSHSLFCDCGHIRRHLHRLFPWPTTTDDHGEDGQQEDGDRTEGPTDLDILAALAEEEAGSGGGSEEGG